MANNKEEDWLLTALHRLKSGRFPKPGGITA